MSANSNNSLFGIHAAALELRSQRMGLLTSNIANAATPGYKARDIDFAAALKAKMGGASTERAMGAAIRTACNGSPEWLRTTGRFRPGVPRLHDRR